jgi:hypothetical protein
MMLWLAPVLRAAGLDVFEVDGWKTRGKDVMNPKVLIAHHTATGTNWSDAALDYFLRIGRSDLPGPLCHIHLTRSGQCRIIAAGMANHAGKGSWKGLSGNALAVGIEAANDGLGEYWPQAQITAYDRASAAILEHIGRDSTYLCGHREWAPFRKIDPTGIALPAMRTRVQSLLQGDNNVIIRQGISGYHVVPWQLALNKALIKNNIPLAPLAVDGVYGAKVTEAVKAYQVAAMINTLVPEPGSLDDYTRDLLVEYTREGD